MPTVGYLPFVGSPRCCQAQWLQEYLGVAARVVELAPSWNEAEPAPLLPYDRLADALAGLLTLPAVVLEGPAGFLWAAVLREQGYRGTVTVLPYLNPRGWRDVLAVALYRRYADRRDRVFVGSRPSAALYSALGAPAQVGEPYGIDDRVFRPQPDAAPRVRAALGLAAGRVLLYAGRAQPDKDLYRLLRVVLRARLLFPDLTVVIASHVCDQDYLAAAREQLQGEAVRFVPDPPARQLADLYTVADVFVTAATSRFETFGRAPAEALACGCPVVAPRYDGFVELLDQPGGTVTELAADRDAAGWPVADEAALLRGVYDVLSSPPPDRAAIASIGQLRFGRSRTISLLRHLRDGAGALADQVPVPPAPLELPLPWQAELAELAGMDRGRALARCWDQDRLHRLALADAEFVAQVRRSLCVAPEPTVRSNREERLACR